jgi:hypothetical protein
MLRSLKDIGGYTLNAVDGEIGKIDSFLFDDARWIIRYCIVDVGPWLFGRKVLISPASVEAVETSDIITSLKKDDIKNAPDIDTDKPVSRQQEIELANYYSWPFYWNYYTFPYAYPAPAYQAVPNMPRTVEGEKNRKEKLNSGEYDQHLRSTKELIGYSILATDGEIGHASDFIAQTQDWTIRYLVVDTGHWFTNNKVLISPSWIKRIVWHESSIEVSQSREKIKNAPEFDPAAPVNRTFEERMYDYYGQPK